MGNEKSNTQLWSAAITLKALANFSPGFALKPWVKKGTFISSQL
jgi:hypothetical protein